MVTALLVLSGVSVVSARVSYRLVGHPIAVLDFYGDGTGRMHPVINVYVRLDHSFKPPQQNGYADLVGSLGNGEGFFTVDLPGQRAHPCYVQAIEELGMQPLPLLRRHRIGTSLPLEVVITGRPQSAQRVIFRTHTAVRLQRDANQNDHLLYPRKLGCEKPTKSTEAAKSRATITPRARAALAAGRPVKLSPRHLPCRGLRTSRHRPSRAAFIHRPLFPRDRISLCRYLGNPDRLLRGRSGLYTWSYYRGDLTFRLSGDRVIEVGESGRLDPGHSVPPPAPRTR